jgi:hypothetical protein
MRNLGAGQLLTFLDQPVCLASRTPDATVLADVGIRLSVLRLVEDLAGWGTIMPATFAVLDSIDSTGFKTFGRCTSSYSGPSVQKVSKNDRRIGWRTYA